MANLDVKETEARKRLTSLFDDGSFTEIDAYAKSVEGSVEVVAGFGTVNENAVYAFSQDVTVDGGAISKAQCAKIKKIYDLAAKTGCPIVGIYDSNGMKLNEGFDVMNAYGEILKASTSVSGVVPQVSLIAGACLGTTALMANAGDVVVAVKDADYYLSAPSSVSAEESYKAGVVDILADDFAQAVEAVKDVISVLPSNNLSAAPIFDFSNDDSFLSNDCKTIKADTKEIVKAIADSDSVVELQAGYGKSVVTALATVMGSTVGFVGFSGKAICPHSTDKVSQFVNLCDAYNLPVITLVNSEGFLKDDAVNAKMLKCATQLTSVYASATCAKISVITGEAIGASYIALAGKGSNADVTFAWSCSTVSALDVESAVAFKYDERLAAGEDRQALAEEYKNSEASPLNAAACGSVDDVFVASETRGKIIAALDMLSGKRETTLPRKHSVK